MPANVTLCVISDAVPRQACLDALRAQRGGPYPIFQVNDTYPYHRALNRMVRVCRSQYIIQVPGYAVPHPYVVESLLTAIQRSQWMFCARIGLPTSPLWAQQYVYAWRRFPVRLFRFSDVAEPEMRMWRRLCGLGLYHVPRDLPIDGGALDADLPEYLRFGLAKLKTRQVMATRDTRAVNDHLGRFQRHRVLHIFPELWGSTFALLDREQGSRDGRRDYAEYEALAREIAASEQQKKGAA